jgi:hypothetical protein
MGSKCIFLIKKLVEIIKLTLFDNPNDRIWGFCENKTQFILSTKIPIRSSQNSSIVIDFFLWCVISAIS